MYLRLSTQGLDWHDVCCIHV